MISRDQLRPGVTVARRGPAALPPPRALGRLTQALESRGASVVTLTLVAFVGVLGSFQVAPNGLLVFALIATIVFEFQKRIDQGLPLMQIAALLAVLQWTVGPVFAYGVGMLDARYTMYVDEASYFSYALPGTAAFVFGLLSVGSSIRQRGLLRFVTRDRFVLIGLVLNLIAVLARIGAAAMPGGLSFAFHLLSQVSYVGVLYFLFSGSKYRWLLILLSLLPLFKTSAESAMFHDMLLWSGLLFCYWYGMRKHALWNKVLLLAGAALILFTIQAIKQSYRAKVWYGQEASLVEEVIGFWSSDQTITSADVQANVIVRLNQGWIISAVLYNVPNYEPFAEGETVQAALVAALVPRFLLEDKVGAGGQINFRRFTGLPLAESTSMAISPLGEAYANFGRTGGILLMLVFGLCFAGFYAFCLRRAVVYPDFLFWIPLIFYQALKAETELVTVLNQVTKGTIVAFGLHWLLMTKVVPLLSRAQLPDTILPARRMMRPARGPSGPFQAARAPGRPLPPEAERPL